MCESGNYICLNRPGGRSGRGKSRDASDIRARPIAVTNAYCRCSYIRIGYRCARRKVLPRFTSRIHNIAVSCGQFGFVHLQRQNLRIPISKAILSRLSFPPRVSPAGSAAPVAKRELEKFWVRGSTFWRATLSVLFGA